MDKALDLLDNLEDDTGSYRTHEWVVPVGAPVVVYGSMSFHLPSI
jgi:hypothetical protein